MRDLVVIGCGGFGRETADIVDAINAARPTWDLLGFLDDSPSDADVARVERRGSRHLGPVGDFRAPSETAYVVGIGSAQVRRRVAESAERSGLVATTLVHPTANLGANFELGTGSIVAGHVDIGSDVAVGRHVHLDRGVQVGHDSRIDDFVTAHPHAVISGACHVGSGAELGTNCTLLPGVNVGLDSIVGAAACVTADVPPSSKVKGVPARVGCTQTRL